MAHNISTIFNLVQEALSDDQLQNLCFCHFRLVYDEFTEGQSKNSRIRSLVDYVDRQEEISQLLAEIQKLNPNTYGRYSKRINLPVTESEDLNLSQLDIGCLYPEFDLPDYPDFFGREDELQALENLVRSNRVVVVYGDPGVGKTYLSSRVVKQLSKEYNILPLHKEEKSLTLDELLSASNKFLNAHGEYGFNTTYTGSNLENTQTNAINTQKIPMLVKVISGSQKPCIFLLDGYAAEQFQNSSAFLEIKEFIERFSSFAGNSRLILVGNQSKSFLGTSLASKAKDFCLTGFSEKDANEYIRLDIVKSWKPEDITAIIKKTKGHPMAINLVVHCQPHGYSVKNILKNIVKYDEESDSILNKKLFEDIERNLGLSERTALYKLSVFETPINSSAWEYFNISSGTGKSLLKLRLLTRVSNDEFEMHPLIRNFWQANQTPEDLQETHQKAAKYYWDLGKSNSQINLSMTLYLASYYHFCACGLDDLAGQIINELSYRRHQDEPSMSEVLPGLTEWLINLDKEIFVDKPWLVLENGRTLEKSGQKEESEKIFREAYADFEMKGDQLGILISLYNVGKILHSKKQPKFALDVLNRVIQMSKNNANAKTIQIRTLGKLVSCHTDIGEYDKAMRLADDADRLALQYDDKLGHALIIYRKGSVERHQSNFERAEVFFSESVELFKALGDIYRESKSYSRLGIVQERLTKYSIAAINLEKAVSLKKSISDNYGHALDLDYLANVYRSQGLYEKAETYYKQSLSLKKKEQDVYGQVKTYNNLARIALSIRKFSQVENYLQEAGIGIEKLKLENSRFIGVEGSYLILHGDLNLERGDYKSSLKFYNLASNIFKQFSHDRGRVLLSFGRVYIELKQLDIAERYLNSAIEIFEICKTSYHHALALTYLARIKSFCGQIDKSINDNKIAMSIAANPCSPAIQVVCLETQGLIEEMRILKDSLFDSTEYTKLDEVVLSKTSQVIEYYDQAISIAIEIYKESYKDIVRLKIRKSLWRITVKYFYRINSCVDEREYKLLLAESGSNSLLEIEVLNVYYTLQVLGTISPFLAKHIAEYALNVISPLAMRLNLNQLHGISHLREKIESKAFYFLHPSEYQAIDQYIQKKYAEVGYIKRFIQKKVEEKLQGKNIVADVITRIKSPYSIYRKKNERKGVTLDKIIDIIGVRIITQTQDDCYKVLSVIETLGKTFDGAGILSESKRDYIERPKSNGYQSIHINININIDMNSKISSIDTSEEVIVEFQIRTLKMDLKSEFGSSSHSQYKDKTNYSRPSTKRDSRSQQVRKLYLKIECQSHTIEILGQILHNSKFEILSLDVNRILTEQTHKISFQIEIGAKSGRAWEDSDFLDKALTQLLTNIREQEMFVSYFEKEEINDDFRSNKLSLKEKIQFIDSLFNGFKSSSKFIYALTPKGDIKKLQQGSTPIDFAYQIHSGVGNHCERASINGRLVPLNTPLQNGDTVEIITNKNAKPKLEWLNTSSDSTGNYPFAITKTAHNRIIQCYKKIYRDETIILGTEMLLKELNKFEKKFNKNKFQLLLKSKILQEVAGKFNYHSVQDLLAAIGYGPIRLNLVASKTTSKQTHEKISKLRYVAVTPLQIVNQLIQKGKEKIENVIGKKYIALLLESKEYIYTLLVETGYDSLNDLFVNIHFDDFLVLQEKIDNLCQKISLSLNLENVPTSISYQQHTTISSTLIESEGSHIALRGLPFYLAECCSPCHYDSSIGFSKKDNYKKFPAAGRGIIVHRSDCSNLIDIVSEKRRPIIWYLDIQIQAINRPNILSEITSEFGSETINIEEVHVVKEGKNKSSINLHFDVYYNYQLIAINDILKRIRRIENVFLIINNTDILKTDLLNLP
jgi:(p)ppGpp synthase/HD superfamily hydrolase/ATP/maltotriose-dependent transcriptional regulator MalT